MVNAHDFHEQTPYEPIDVAAIQVQAFKQRYDLVFLGDACLGLTPAQLQNLIAKCRDQLAPRVLLELPIKETGDTLSMTDCLALGFIHCAVTSAEQQHHYYLFDLETYKPVPDWLNPKFWANPQNWDRFRW